MHVQFGECLLDSETRELIVRGKQAHATPKAFQLLEILLANRPKALSKAAIHEQLWPGTFVSDGTLTSLLAEIRSAIGEDGRNPRFIRTVHGFGYAFSGEAREQAEEASTSARRIFKLIWADREIALHEGENILGRDRDAVAWIDVHSVSRHHARIVISGTSATIEDLGSKNGTFLDGRRLTSPKTLSDGSRVRIGTVETTLRRYEGGVSTESALSQ
jgi:DNA-binding winged helix-turn-helix (wHTH) protein